jgi:hypothetical protein
MLIQRQPRMSKNWRNTSVRVSSSMVCAPALNPCLILTPPIENVARDASVRSIRPYAGRTQSRPPSIRDGRVLLCADSCSTLFNGPSDSGFGHSVFTTI